MAEHEDEKPEEKPEEKVEDKKNLNMDDLKRMSNGNETKGDHVHELSNQTLTGGAIPALTREGHHFHFFGEDGKARTQDAEDGGDHSHDSDLGETGGPR